MTERQTLTAADARDQGLDPQALACLTQSQAGALVHAGLRAWQKWEAGELRMHPAFWDLFRRRVAAGDYVTG